MFLVFTKTPQQSDFIYLMQNSAMTECVSNL